MFDPALVEGYWGCREIPRATEVFISLRESHAGKILGVRVSLLDAAHEIAQRNHLPTGVRL